MSPPQMAPPAATSGPLPPSDLPTVDLDVTLTPNPNGTTPLTALLQLELERAATVTVYVDGPERWSVTSDTEALDHSLALVGFKPNQQYELDIVVAYDDAQQARASEALQLTTDPLPEAFPNVALIQSQPARMMPGHTLMTASRSGTYQLIVDEQGEVIWYYEAAAQTWDIRQLDDGQLLLQEGGALLLMDLLGNVKQRFTQDPQDMAYHHEVSTTSRGTYWTLGNRTYTANDFPVDYSDLGLRQTAEITDDTLIELDPEAGVLQRLHLIELLDPYRIGYDSLEPHPELRTPRDWAHTNAILEVDDGQNLLVSCRNQDAVFKLRKETREVLWILANHDNWTLDYQDYLLEPVGDDFEWPYHQHAPELTPDGTILMFDNGNYRASPSDGRTKDTPADGYSRVVEYQVDEQVGTVEQLWSFQHPDHLFSLAVGDADLQPNGTVLAVFGAMAGIGPIANSNFGRGQLQGRVVEIDRNASDEIVFEVEMYSDDPDDYGWFIYRAERIPAIR